MGDNNEGEEATVAPAAPGEEEEENSDTEKYLEDIYYDPKRAGAFSGNSTFYRAVKKLGDKRVTRKDIEQFLLKTEPYALHHRVQYRFPRNRVIVSGYKRQCDCDLMDMQKLSESNDGVRYLIVVIEILSRFLWVEPVKDKTGKSLVKGLQNVFNRGGKAELYRMDKGTEFTNRLVVNFFRQEGVRIYFTENTEVKANYAERVIRTLRGRLFRYLTFKNSDRYIDDLQNIVHGYNNTVHSSLSGLSPSQVSEENEVRVWANQYLDEAAGHSLQRRQPFKYRFRVGDYVRVSFLRRTFQREHDIRWSQEIFVVAHRFARQGKPIYRIKDLHGELIRGSFYQWELLEAPDPNKGVWKIEKIVRRRGRPPNVQYLVKWLGWPDSFNSWVNSADVQDISDIDRETAKDLARH